jgi:AAA domain
LEVASAHSRPASGGDDWRTLSVLIAKSALPRSLGDAPPPEVAAALAQLPGAFGQLGLATGDASLNIKALRGQSGLYRLRVGDWRVVFVKTGEGFLVAAIGLREDIYERVGRMRLARKGEGLRVIEVAVPEVEASDASSHARLRARARAPKAVEQNQLTPFSDAELRRLDGMDDELVSFLRSLPPSIDVGEALSARLADPDLVVLLTDLWEQPGRHADAFRDGGAPTTADVVVDEDELARRVVARESETEIVATESEGQIRRLLDGTIEEWMVYLHPSQRAIIRANFNGPSRVRGAPGTGKTVVALHRARRLAREAPDGERVLLTTFLRTLPKVWQGLMGTMDPRALERLDVVNVDALAMRIVRGSSGAVSIMEESGRRPLAGSLLKRHALGAVFAGNESLLLEEFDAFITGRGTTDPESHFALRRRGGGVPPSRAQREQVWAAYQEYLHQIARSRRLDYATLRVRALEAIKQGHGERYAGVIVDEAQDITEVGVRLLFGLDASPEHHGFMAVGDGQQSIYPGGFSLRSLGIDVRGRARVLTTNWRNTWNVWTAARAMMEGEAFDDLDEDVGLRPTGDEPEPLTVGEPAELHVLRSPGEELELLAALVEERIAAGTDPGDIAVLVDVNRKGDDVARTLSAAGIKTTPLERYEGEHADGVLVGTLKRSKGLEFKEVFVPGLAAAEWPSRWFVPPDLPEASARSASRCSAGRCSSA